jgi:hypothetical protein
MIRRRPDRARTVGAWEPREACLIVTPATNVLQPPTPNFQSLAATRARSQASALPSPGSQNSNLQPRISSRPQRPQIATPPQTESLVTPTKQRLGPSPNRNKIQMLKYGKNHISSIPLQTRIAKFQGPSSGNNSLSRFARERFRRGSIRCVRMKISKDVQLV